MVGTGTPIVIHITTGGDAASIVVALAQTLLAVIALWVGWRALGISREVQNDATSERQRADSRHQLMWMHTALNELKKLQNAASATNAIDYADSQLWLRTSIAVGGVRSRLPETVALSERPLSDGWPGMVEAVDRAREELHAAIAEDAPRAYANEILG
jgi:hypothetical protein